MPRARDIILLLAFTLVSASHAADIVKGDVSSALGPDFFFDDALTGGGDNVATTFNREISGYWSAGETVTLRGIGWASSGDDSKNTANSATVTFIDLGPDGVFGTPDDVVHGPVTDAFIDGTAGEYLWDFDSDIVFTATGPSLRISISSNGGTLTRKTLTGTGQASVKLSLAGTAGLGGPPPFTATASGFWDEVSWDNGSGTSTGGFDDGDSALVGSNRTVTYRGVPAAEQLAVLNLGDNSANTGQGRLKVNSGTLHVTGNLSAGRNDSANDAFVFVEGGTLHVGGDAVFGRSTGSCDGSLPTSGFAIAVLEYRAATRMLTLSLGGTSVSLAIPGSYSSLTHTAMGTAAMEGELTMLRAMQPGSSATHAVATIDPTGDPLVIDLDLGSEPPFAPRMERSAGLTAFAPDPDALVEPLGGGLYRINAPASGLPAEFFRFRNDQP